MLRSIAVLTLLATGTLVTLRRANSSILRGAAVAALLLLCLASQARAQGSKDFGVWCMPGGIVRACASVQIWNALNPNTSLLEFGIYVRNLEGSPGFENLTHAIGIKGWFIHNLDFQCFAPDGCSPIIGRASLLELTGLRGIDEWRVSTQVGRGYTVGYTPETNDDARIFGCNPPSASEFDPVTYSEFTCDAPLEHRVIDGEHAPGGYAVTRRAALTFYVDQSFSHETSCTTSRRPVFSSGGDLAAGHDLTRGAPRCVRVPEPDSWLLLASGLLALGAAGYTRRRRA